jgi:RNA polymerase sigma-70 factor (ECF subfamily)
MMLIRVFPVPMSETPFNPIGAHTRSLHEDGEELRQSGTYATSEQLLMERIRIHDQMAMAEVFDRYGGLVYSVALRVLKEPAQAEDVMQEIFFQLWKGAGSYAEGRGSLGAWLAVVARNRAIDSLRRRKPTDSVDDVVLPAKTDLSSEIEQNLMIEKVRSVMKELPPEQQRMVELAFFEGMSHSEIAAKTGDALGTVKTRIRSALMSLRKGVLG